MTTVSPQPRPLPDDELALIDAWWRAANYLAVGQIYLLDNPLLREPLRLEHTKPRLLGHWGTTPGLNFVYAHMNRVIRKHGRDAIFVCGPGHGGPAVVASTYLEGSYTELYPHITRDEAGMRALFHQFSFPGGIPSHAAPETPGSIHEGGELGYALVHAYGAAFDNPDLLVACVIGDGEAETGRSRRAGTRTSSSTRHAMAPSSRSCTSTATRSPIPRCSRASPSRSSSRCSRATATTRTSCPGTFPRTCTSRWPRPSTRSSTTSRSSRTRGGAARRATRDRVLGGR